MVSCDVSCVTLSSYLIRHHNHVLWSLLHCLTTVCSFACCSRIRSPAPPSSSLLPASWTFVQQSSSKRKTIAWLADKKIAPAVVFHTNGPHHGGRHHVKVPQPDLSKIFSAALIPVLHKRRCSCWVQSIVQSLGSPVPWGERLDSALW